MQKLAVVDIGSNALRLAIGQSGKLSESYIERFPLRLGADTFNRGLITPYSQRKLVSALEQFQVKARQENVQACRYFATSALREASNKQSVLNLIKRRLNINIELISGDLEAKILNFAVLDYYKDELTNASFIMDIGGGSVELILNKGRRMQAISLPIGTVRLLSKSKNRGQVWESSIRRNLRRAMKQFGAFPKSTCFIGTGGNVKSLGKLAYYTGISSSLERLSYVSMLSLVSILESMTCFERQRLLGLKKDRADVILPAAYTICNLMEIFELNSMHIPRVGLKNGFLLNPNLFTKN